jgi:hypothetical protein
MEFFSLDPDVPLMELEKECLSSGKALNDLYDVIRLVRSDARPRRHVRNAIAASIIAMYRINKAASMEVFEVKSFQLALQMKDAITPTNSYYKNDDRRLIIADLYIFYHAMEKVINRADDDMTENLRALIKPEHVVFDLEGSLSPEIVAKLRRAGATNISIFPDTAGRCTVEVRGSTSETEFEEMFSKLTVSNTLNVVYQQAPVEKLHEESHFIQMGDYTGPDFPFCDESRDEDDITLWGGVEKGTVGALLLVQDPLSSQAVTM